MSFVVVNIKFIAFKVNEQAEKLFLVHINRNREQDG